MVDLFEGRTLCENFSIGFYFQNYSLKKRQITNKGKQTFPCAYYNPLMTALLLALAHWKNSGTSMQETPAEKDKRLNCNLSVVIHQKGPHSVSKQRFLTVVSDSSSLLIANNMKYCRLCRFV